MSQSEIGLSHRPLQKKRLVPDKTIKQERRRSRFTETGSYYIDQRPDGADMAGVATTKGHGIGLFGAPPKGKIKTSMRTWGSKPYGRDTSLWATRGIGLPDRESAFMKQMFNKEQYRRRHNEDQAELLRKIKTNTKSTYAVQQEKMRRRPLRNKRAIGDKNERRAFYQKEYRRARSQLRSAPPGALRKNHRVTKPFSAAPPMTTPKGFTWRDSFSPTTREAHSNPEFTEDERDDICKPNPRRGVAVGYWNMTHLNTKLRENSFTASGGTVANFI